MIDITDNLIKTNGVIPAIILTCAQMMEQHILRSGMSFKNFDFSGTERILTHKAPHIDEYIALMIIRAALPDGRKLIPLEETYLSDAKNDIRAQHTWPESILLGFGGTQDGGAHAGILFDEHESDEEAGQVKESSVAMLVKNKLLKGQLSVPLFHILREIDHIDSNGGAGTHNLSIYVKRFHTLDLIRGHDKNGNIINDRMDAAWKEASVSACVLSLIMADEDRIAFSSKAYWDKRVKDDMIQSLEFYKQHSPVKDDPDFERVYDIFFKDCTAKFPFRATNEDVYALTVKSRDGTRTALKDSKGNRLRQLMLLPYIASLCKTYWGETLANIIMFPFWDTQIQQNIIYRKCRAELEHIIDSSAGKPVINFGSSIGQVSILYSDQYVECEVKGADKKTVRQNFPVVLLDVSSNILARNAMTSILREKFHNVGYVIFRNLDKSSPSIILSKGANIPPKIWEALTKELIRRDGSADSRVRIGAWHKVADRKGRLETFILNGNSAHLYVSRVKRTSKGFMKLISDIHRSNNSFRTNRAH